jgi:hypothetical protein
MRKLAAVLLPLLLFACSTPQTQSISTSATDSTFVLRNARDVAAIRAAYQERVRLGLGSPFRTIEIAAYDERLTPQDREELLRDLFERVADGETYQIGATLPGAHYRVIEHALHSTHDPRIAELAVNLAYEIAVTDKTVTPELQYAAASTIALLRDRALARLDARHVREVARMHGLAAYALVPAMRAQRALNVEQPLMPALSAEQEEAATRLALLLIGGVRQAARTPQPYTQPKAASELPRDVAERILALQRPAERPPQSALIIAMRSAQLPFTGRDEETFVAELSLTNESATLAAQRAAIAMRTFNQESVRARARDRKRLFADFGVTVRYNADVPESWHTHYANTLYDALDDITSVVPDISLKGLTIEVGEVRSGARHLAYHDPRARVIRWAPSTGAGSLAHEIGHDLDWQLARRAYGRRSGYASDLAGGVAGMPFPAGSHADERATEAFARQFDWVVASALASVGRMNGQLSSVQHDWLPGHGSARAPVSNSWSDKRLAAEPWTPGRLGAAAPSGADVPAVVRAVRQVRAAVGAIAESAAGPTLQEYLMELGSKPSVLRTSCCKSPTPEGGLSPFETLTFLK